MDEFSGEKSQPIGIEQKEKEPKISYHFFYSPHRTAEDFKKIKIVFDECDIYVPEASGWSPEEKFFTESISEGNPSPENLAIFNKELVRQSAWGEQLSAIYKSKKPILFADISNTDELIRKREEVDELGADFVYLFFRGELDAALKKLRAYAIAFSLRQSAREEKIEENLKNKIKEFLENHPEYRQKDKLKVLISLGSGHTPLFQDLKREGLNVSREFNETPQVFSSLAEADRRRVFKKEISDELLAKVIIENILYPYLGSLTDNTNKQDRVLRKISSQLNLETIRRISETMAKESFFVDRRLLVEELKKMNIKIPKSEEEMDEMLGIKK